MAKGFKTGGRTAGTPNKRTQEIIAQAAADARQAGPRRKRAIEILDDIMQRSYSMAAHYQENPPGAPTNPNQDVSKYRENVEYAIASAKALAPFQSPTFKAIAVVAAPPEERPAPTGQQVVPIRNAVELQRAYQKLIRRVV